MKSAIALDQPASSIATRIFRSPPHTFFLVSAVFHYLGPAFAVLLFAFVAPLGVAWLRIASAAVIFAVWRKPWRLWFTLDRSSRLTVIALGIVLAAMNSIFYLAIARLPLSTVGAIEFIGPITLAALGMRTMRNFGALSLAAAGVYVLTDIRIVHEPLGFVFAFANCALFILYVVLGHRIARASDGASSAPVSADEHARIAAAARSGAPASSLAPASSIPPAGPVITAGGSRAHADPATEQPIVHWSGIDRLALSMLIAAIAAAPIGFLDAAPAFEKPTLLAAAIGVGVSSSVIPYVCDQLAMARLSRSAFALLLSLLPATAAVVGAVVLHQIPNVMELVGIGLVILGVAIHREHT
jgi:inner membrane transporter RhtA